MAAITPLQPGRRQHAMRFLIFISLLCHPVSAERFCGVDEEDAKWTCGLPCGTDNDCCDGSRCYDTGWLCWSPVSTGTNHNFCGVSWCDAADKCGTACPDHEGCPDGEACFAGLPCNSFSPKTAPPLPAPPTASPYQFCGSSMSDAKNDCWQPCPRGESDCCFGLKCYDTSTQSDRGETCSNSDDSGTNHFYCGSSWCDAAYECNAACPDGTNEECPNGQYCYADVPCSGSGSAPPPPNVDLSPSTFSKYCGMSVQHAAAACWQPCRDDDDCCFGQTCFSEVTACTYPDNIGADHFFCGTDYCDATSSCSLPCPSGFDADCPSGQRCIANTPCNANVREITTRSFDYGLPRSVAHLANVYQPKDIEQTQTANIAKPTKTQTANIAKPTKTQTANNDEPRGNNPLWAPQTANIAKPTKTQTANNDEPRGKTQSDSASVPLGLILGLCLSCICCTLCVLPTLVRERREAAEAELARVYVV